MVACAGPSGLRAGKGVPDATYLLRDVHPRSAHCPQWLWWVEFHHSIDHSIDNSIDNSVDNSGSYALRSLGGAARTASGGWERTHPLPLRGRYEQCVHLLRGVRAELATVRDNWCAAGGGWYESGAGWDDDPQ